MTPLPTPTTPEALLVHTAWIRSLADRLVRDPSVREDILQETWLVSLRHRPEVTNPRGWLARVLRNLSWESNRSEARREALARRAEPPREAEEPHVVVARAELQRRLVEAVLELEEPVRTTMLLRYFEDRSSDEIASQLRVAPATVRSHLHRGIERLRRRFRDDPRQHRAAWCALLAVPPRTGASGSPLVGAGGRSMLRTVLLAAAAAGAVLVTFVTFGVLDPLGDTPVRFTAPSEPRAAGGPAALPAVDPPPSPIPGEPRREAAAPSSGDGDDEGSGGPEIALGGIVTDPAGRPVPGARVFVVEQAQGAIRFTPTGHRTATGDDGRFSLPAGAWAGASNRYAVAEKDGFVPMHAPLVAERDTHLLLRPAASVLGRVLDAETRQPIDGAIVDFPNLTWRDGVLAPPRTDASGRFRFDAAPYPDLAMVFVVAPGRLPAVEMVNVDAAQVDVEVLLARGATLSGEVVALGDGTPVAGAVVRWEHHDVARTDASGRFVVGGVTDDVVELTVAAEGFVTTSDSVEVGRGEARLPLLEECVLRGTIRAADGSPSGGARVAVGYDAASAGIEGLSPGSRFASFEVEPWFSDAGGRFECRSLPFGRALALTVALRDGTTFGAEERAFTAPGESRSVDLVAPYGDARLTGRVLENGTGTTATITWTHRGLHRSTQADATGAFAFEDLPAGAATLVVATRDEGRCEFPVVLEADETLERSFSLDVATILLAGRTIDDRGDPLRGVTLSCRVASDEPTHELATWRLGRATSTADGSFVLRVPGGPGDRFDVVADPSGVAVVLRSVAAGTNDLEFVVPALVDLPVRFYGEDLSDVVLTWRRRGETHWSGFGRDTRVDVEDGVRDTTLRVPVGVIEVRARARVLGRRRVVDLSDVEVSREPGAGLDVRFD